MFTRCLTDMMVLFFEIEPDDSSSARCFQRGRHAHLGKNQMIATNDAPLIYKVNNFGEKNIVARLFPTNELLLREVYWPPVLPEKYIIS